RTWKRYNAWITKVKLNPPDVPFGDPTTRSSIRTRIRRAVGIFGKFYGQVNSIVDSVSISLNRRRSFHIFFGGGVRTTRPPKEYETQIMRLDVPQFHSTPFRST